MTLRQLSLAWTGSWLLCASGLQGAPIAHEPFDYRPRLALPTLDGGTGFSGPWQMVSSRDVPNPDGGYIGGGRAGGIGEGDLSVAGLASSGNRYRNWVWTDTESSAVMQWRQLSTTYDNSIPGASDLWVSYVVTVNGSAPTSSQYFEVNFHQIDTVTPNPYIQTATNDAARTTTLRIGKLASRSGWSWAWTRFQGDSGSANTPVANARNFVVARIAPKSGGGSTISLWVNPTIGATAPTTGDIATGNIDRNSAYAVKFNALGISHDKSTQIDLDEIRVGTTWADVCPAASTGRLVVTGNNERLVSGAAAQGKNHTDFGTATTGSGSVVRTFAITNEGSAAISTLNASIGGGSGFSVTTAPATSLAATAAGSTAPASTNVAVTFTPTVSGPASDTLTISHAGGSPFTVPLAGFGTSAGAGLTLSQPVSYRVFQRNASDVATVPVVGTYTGTISKIQYRTRLHAGAAGSATDWTDLVASPSGGVFSANVSLPAGGWYYLDVRTLNGATETARATVDRVGSGEVFVVSGQSNSANAGAFPNSAPDDRVATVDWTLADNANGGVAFIRVTNGGSGYTSAPTVSFSGSGGATATAIVSGGVVTGVTVTNPGSAYQSGPTVSFSGGGGTGAAATAFLYPSSDAANWPQTLGWRRGDAPLGPSDGNRGSVWPVLGGKLVETLGVPVAFIAVGRGGMPIEAWRDGDGRQMLWPLLNALNYVGPSGARAVLWHQGESNGHMTTAGPYYNEINALISRSRSSGWSVDWVVAQASILGDAATNLAVVGDQAKIADDFAYVYPGPNTDQMLNATGVDPAYRNNPGVRWDNIHFNPKGMEMHASGWVTKLNAAYSLSSILASAPPAWSPGYPKADTATLSGFTLRARANEIATAYYVVLASGAAAPSAAQVKAGQDASGVAALRSGSIALSTSNTEYSAALTDLTSGTAYVAYLIAEDGDGNLQAEPASVVISTLVPDITPPEWISGWPMADTATSSGFTLRARINEAGTAYYVVVADGATAPSITQIVAGQNASGAPALRAGNLMLNADTEGSASLTGLSAITAYDIYFVARDAADPANTQSMAVKVDANTIAAPNGLIAYESFNYTASSALTGGSGGTGWGSNVWSLGSGTAPTIAASGLTHPGLVSEGLSASQNTSAAGSILRALGASASALDADNDGILGDTVTSAAPQTLWLSFLARRTTGSGGGDAYLALVRDGGLEAIRVGRFTGSVNWQVGSPLNGNLTASTVAWDGSTATRLAVLRVDIKRDGAGTGANRYDAWLWLYNGGDTLPADAPSTASASASFLTTTNAGSGTGIQAVRLLNTAGKAADFDEIRVGSDYASVKPVPLTALQSWRFTHFGQTAGTGIAADDFDPDEDGIPNVIEYAFGTNPTLPSDRGNLPAIGMQDVSGQTFLKLSFTPQVVAGIIFRVEASPDLTDWSDQTDISNQLQPGTPHTHLDHVDLATAGPLRRFLRLAVLQE